MSDHEEDPLIDAVARRLTTVTDDSGFRARVVSRLPPRVAVRRWRGSMVPAAVTAGLLAGVVGAVLVMREPRVSPTERQVAADVPAASLAQADVAASTDDAARAGMVVPVRRAPRQTMALSTIPTLPLLSTDPLLPMTDIQPAAITTPLLDVTPIATAPLVLAPLDGGKD